MARRAARSTSHRILKWVLIVPAVIVGVIIIPPIIISVHRSRRKQKKKRQRVFHKQREGHDAMVASIACGSSMPELPASQSKGYPHNCVGHYQRSRREQLQSPLYRLPCELRQQIWDLCIASECVYEPVLGSCLGDWPSQPLFCQSPRSSEIRKDIEFALKSRHTPYPDSWPAGSHFSTMRKKTVHEEIFRGGPSRSPCLPGGTQYRELIRNRHSAVWASAWSESSGSIGSSEIEVLETECNSLSILRTCQVIHDEISHRLLRCNTFAFTSLSNLNHFRLGAGATNFGRLRYLHLDLVIGPPVALPGVVERTAWQALWAMVARELLPPTDDGRHARENFIKGHAGSGGDELGLWELELRVQLPSIATMRNWLAWKQQDVEHLGKFMSDLPQWANDLAPLHGRLQHAELLCSVCDDPEWTKALADEYYEVKALEFEEELVQTQALLMRSGGISFT